jgi:exopolysaccharide biosynthesis polyprenyl glycosylphosphotransferase
VEVRALKGHDGETADAVYERSLTARGFEVEPATWVRKRRPPQGGRMRRRAMVTADVIGLFSASALLGLWTAREHDAGTGLVAALFLGAVTVLLWVALAAAYGLYRRDEQRADLTTTDDVVPVLVIASLAVWTILVAFTVTSTNVPISTLVALWVAVIACVLVARGLARTVARSRPRFLQNTLIVGAGDVGQLLGRKVVLHPELGLRLVGFVDDDPKAMRRELRGIPVLGTADEIRELVDRYDVQRIMISFSNESHHSQLERVYALRDLDVQIDLVPRLFEAIGPAVDMHYVEGLPLVALPLSRPSRAARATKRLIDVVGASIGLVVLSPLFLYVAFRVRRSSPGPIFFRQERLGENMRTFELLKFRTMQIDTDDAPHREYVQSIMDTAEAPNHNSLYKLDRSDAVTDAGAWLRRTSMDELPQLINVLRGDMSLVGPRPCLPYERELCEPHHLDRFLVPAGMTGLWQVTARARSTYREMLDLDAAYARDWSLGLDLKLLLRTPFVILGARGTA